MRTQYSTYFVTRAEAASITSTTAVLLCTYIVACRSTNALGGVFVSPKRPTRASRLAEGQDCRSAHERVETSQVRRPHSGLGSIRCHCSRCVWVAKCGLSENEPTPIWQRTGCHVDVLCASRNCKSNLGSSKADGAGAGAGSARTAPFAFLQVRARKTTDAGTYTPTAGLIRYLLYIPSTSWWATNYLPR